MSWMCPVCNGLEPMSPACPRCGAPAADQGRAADWLGPYAPYRPIDDMKRTDGLPDLERHWCVHLLACPQCGYEWQTAQQERFSGTL